MKQIKSDSVFEKKIRIYQPFRIEELNDFYQKHKKEYKNINQLFVSLIFSGLEKEKLMDENASEYYYQSQDMQTNLTDIQSIFQLSLKTILILIRTCLDYYIKIKLCFVGYIMQCLNYQKKLNLIESFLI